MASSALPAVTVTGPESTGKTTLAAALAERFGTVASPEHARLYLGAKLAAGIDPAQALGPQDVEPIARGQVQREDAAVTRALLREAPLVLRDTDLVSTVVYARHYYGACPGWIVEAARVRRAALYLRCDVDVPWMPDAQRDRPQAREALRDLFDATLRELDCRVVAIAGGWAERERRAVAAIDAMLRATA